LAMLLPKDVQISDYPPEIAHAIMAMVEQELWCQRFLCLTLNEDELVLRAAARIRDDWRNVLGLMAASKLCRCGYDGKGPHPCHAQGYKCRQPAQQRFYAGKPAALPGAQVKLEASETWACDACWAWHLALSCSKMEGKP